MSTAPALLDPRLAAAIPARRPRLRSLSPHLLLVANANASGLVRHPELIGTADELLRAGGARVETRLTSTLDELADVLAAPDRRVVLLGGDGSLHAAANVAGAKPELAILPAGRANNVARSLGVPTDLARAARLAVAGAAAPLDLISARADGKRYLAVEGVSVGFHAIARAQYHGRNSADTVAGVKAALSTVAHFHPLTVAVDLDGSTEVMQISQLFVANMPLFGPSLRVAPTADPADGLLDLVAIGGGRAALLGLVPHLRRGTHLGRAGVRHVTAKRIRIATRGGSPVIADTTNLGTGVVELAAVPSALAVVGAGR